MRPGDANSDRRFNSVDFVDVFQAGEYDDLTSKNSTWSEGDWNGDGDFDSVDFVVAFQSGGYTSDDSELVPGDFDHDGIVNATDIDLISAQLRLPTPSLLFDLTQDNPTDFSDLDALIKHILRTSYGDANLDRVFNSGDFVQVFQRGTYEDAVFGNSGWSDGDWDADGDFGTSDLVLAFQAGGYTTNSQPLPSRERSLDDRLATCADSLDAISRSPILASRRSDTSPIAPWNR